MKYFRVVERKEERIITPEDLVKMIKQRERKKFLVKIVCFAIWDHIMTDYGIAEIKVY